MNGREGDGKCDLMAQDTEITSELPSEGREDIFEQCPQRASCCTRCHKNGCQIDLQQLPFEKNLYFLEEPIDCIVEPSYVD